ncbi:MAG: hypothetical protein ABI443_10030 [Chthoniobacterales bacterium]
MKAPALFFIAALYCGTLLAAPIEKEYIVVSGGPSLIEWEKYKTTPHDHWWCNFIHASRIRIEQIREKNGPDVPITWLVYRRAYVRRAERQEHQDLIGMINSVRDKYHVKLVWFDKGSDVINYLNSGMPRNQVKIANFDYFGHSNRACFMFDYSNDIDSGSKSWLHETELYQIHHGLFSSDCHIKSWGCYTAESMSQSWRRATGKKMEGAIGKTDYSTGELPRVSKRWAF